ncbi:MAG: hypothetical protein LAQ69_11145 [Acidobacteriia bacterium]|nr:hypothetical protein [Terriglobia bacterium]
MAETWRYRGQEIDGVQVFLREFIAAHPTSSRWKLSRQLCEALSWKQPNGVLRDVVCRGLLLMLERAGQIQLPPGPEGTPLPHPGTIPQRTVTTASLPDRHHTYGYAAERVAADRHSTRAANGR